MKKLFYLLLISFILSGCLNNQANKNHDTIELRPIQMDVELKEHETLIIHEIHNNQVLYSIEYLNEKEMERYTQSVHIYDVENEDDSVINLSEKGKFLLDNACFYKDKVFLLYNEGYEYDHKFTYFNDENILLFDQNTIYIYNNNMELITTSELEQSFYQYINDEGNTYIILQDQDGQPIIYTFEYNPIQ